MKLTTLTRWSLAALLGGLALGLVGHASGLGAFDAIAPAIQAIGSLWVGSLQLISLPLVIALLLAALSSARSGPMAALGARALGLFLAALILVGVINLLILPLIVSRFAVDRATVDAMTAAVTVPPAAAAARIGASWPSNIFEAAQRGQLFPLLLFAMVFALAVTRLRDEQREMFTKGFQALADAMMVVVQWFLMVTPIGVFCLSYMIALRTGSGLAGVVGRYLGLQIGLSSAWILLFYPAVMVASRVSLRAFARAALPGQVVAVTTRSSAGALPAVVQGALQHGVLDANGTRFVLPLSVSFFRISEVILNPVKLVFFAHLYGVTLEPGAVAVFFATVCVFSIIGTGTPDSGGGIGFRMVPVFVAAGIPIEGVMIAEAVETIPDIFATLANVTSQLGASVVLAPGKAGSATV